MIDIRENEVFYPIVHLLCLPHVRIDRLLRGLQRLLLRSLITFESLARTTIVIRHPVRVLHLLALEAGLGGGEVGEKRG